MYNTISHWAQQVKYRTSKTCQIYSLKISKRLLETRKNIIMLRFRN